MPAETKIVQNSFTSKDAEVVPWFGDLQNLYDHIDRNTVFDKPNGIMSIDPDTGEPEITALAYKKHDPDTGITRILIMPLVNFGHISDDQIMLEAGEGVTAYKLNLTKPTNPSGNFDPEKEVAFKDRAAVNNQPEIYLNPATNPKTLGCERITAHKTSVLLQKYSLAKEKLDEFRAIEFTKNGYKIPPEDNLLL